MPAAAGCGFAYYGHSVKPALTLIIEPDEAGHPSPSAKLIGQALVQEMLPQWRSVLSLTGWNMPLSCKAWCCMQLGCSEMVWCWTSSLTT